MIENKKNRCSDTLVWHGCYRGTATLWSPESYEHPAKMSPVLGFRILEHLEGLGLLKPGGVVLDPMAGVGTVGLAAAVKGFASVLVELEPKFVGYCQQNKAALEKRLGRELPITIIQGDSRYLGQVLEGSGYIGITSPPYLDSDNRGGQGKTTNGLTQEGKRRGGPINRQDYGQTAGQIGNLPDRQFVSVTSPPYGDTVAGSGDGIALNKGLKGYPNKPKNSLGGDRSSPEATTARLQRQREGNIAHIGYNCKGEIKEFYQEAMLMVYTELAKVCSALALVVKNPTRNGKLYPLDEITLRLCEEAGWILHCRHRAILFDEVEQGHLLDGSVKQTNGRLSFFKRLAYRKGSAVSSWEDCLILVNSCKPEGQ